MNLLLEIMKTSTCYQSPPFWLNPLYDKILRGAAELGLVKRPSTSQVYWTDKGAALAKKYGFGF